MKAQEIYDKFISSEAENLLNIDCKAQRSIRMAMDNDSVDNELYALAEEQVGGFGVCWIGLLDAKHLLAP